MLSYKKESVADKMIKGLLLSLVIFLLGAFELYATYRYYHKMIENDRKDMISSGRLWLGIISGGLLCLLGIFAVLGVISG